MGIELSYEYCNKARPQILVSYPKPYDSAEVVDLINQKIIEVDPSQQLKRTGIGERPLKVAKGVIQALKQRHVL